MTITETRKNTNEQNDEPDLTPIQSAGMKYLEEGLAALDQVLVGETEAKEMLLTAAIAGSEQQGAVANLGGDAGGAKTGLMNAFVRLFKETDEVVNITRIPIDSYLKPTQVGGGIVDTPKERIDHLDGMEKKTQWEEITRVKGLLHPTTKFVLVDEADKDSEAVLNFLLQVLEDRELTNTEGTFKLDDHFMSIFTQNAVDPDGSNSILSHILSPPLASRMASGAVVGDVKEKEIDGELVTDPSQWEIYRDAYKKKPKINPEIKPIFTISRLKEIRQYAASLATGVEEEKYGYELIRLANRGLRDFDISEAYRRMSGQQGAVARATSAVRGETTVSEEALFTATHRMVVARLIARSAIKDSLIEQTALDILS
jgi:MoxR-like ATPase